VTGRFLDMTAARHLARPLAGPERAVKRAMLECFESQRAVLEPFLGDLTEERFRQAPQVDFGAPPHTGPLWYERLGFPIAGSRWRGLAQRALRELRLERGGGAEAWR
jgi:hypothetical protein